MHFMKQQDGNMYDQIKEKLAEIEQEYNINILYAVESGSRAWGFASTNSDWDVRFIYMPRLKWYFKVFDNQKDSIEKMLPNDLDFSGWEIRKALKLFSKSNPPLLEWLDSPIVYKEDTLFTYGLRALRDLHFSPKSCVYHYLHMAENNYDLFLQKDLVKTKKYFYVLRPVLACSWICRTGTPAPILFDTLVSYELHDPEVYAIVEELLAQKKSGKELNEGPRIPVLNNYLIEQIDKFKELVKTQPVSKIDANDNGLNNLLYDTVMRYNLNNME